MSQAADSRWRIYNTTTCDTLASFETNEEAWRVWLELAERQRFEIQLYYPEV